MKGIVTSLLLAAALLSQASVVTQEVVIAKSDGTLTVPSIALLADLAAYAVYRSGTTQVHSNDFALVYRDDDGTMKYMLKRLDATGGRVWYFTGMAGAAYSAGALTLGNFSFELGSDGRPVLKNGTATVGTIPYSSEVVTTSQLTAKVNEVKELHWDPTLSVTWTNVVDNGHIYYVTVTNTNVSTL